MRSQVLFAGSLGFLTLLAMSAGAVADCSPIQTIPDQVCVKVPPTGATNCMPQLDRDGDGIADSVEASLIERFSPLLRFTVEKDGGSDKYHPMDMIEYIRHSDLVVHNDPAQIVVPNSILQTHPEKVVGGTINVLVDYENNKCVQGSLRQVAAIQGQLDKHSDNNPDVGTYDLGAEWSVVDSQKHVGMYAHVSPFMPGSAADLTHFPTIARQQDNGQPVIPPSAYETICKTDRCFKLEYYQFFGFNQAWADLGYGNHQADLAILTEVYDATHDEILAVSHWAHGIEMRYDLKSPKSLCTVDLDKISGEENTCRGENNKFSDFNILSVNLVAGKSHQDEPQKAQNNQLSLAQDPTTNKFTHPVVFVEAGSHEFWPSSKWGAQYAPSHAGNDSFNHYIAQNIPNLGEIEHPLSQDAQTILWYNGFWGNWNKSNDVSPGPQFHASWNWFVPNRPTLLPSEAER
jgi:hypothetical protein